MQDKKPYEDRTGGHSTQGCCCDLSSLSAAKNASAVKMHTHTRQELRTNSDRVPKWQDRKPPQELHGRPKRLSFCVKKRKQCTIGVFGDVQYC